jgi:outer membrane protein assembly factor BamB
MVVNAISGLFVLDPEDGAILWQTSSFDTDFRVIDVGEDDVVVASAVETWVVDLEQGEDQWRVPLIVGSTVMATEDSVVVWESDRIEVFDRATGELRWDLSGIDQVAVAADGSDIVIRVGADLLLFDRVAVEQWTQPTQPAGLELWLLDASVVTVAEGQTGTVLTARDREDGSLLWSRDLDIGQGAGVASDAVIVLSNDSDRVGLDAATGAELWRTDAPASDDETVDDHDGLSVEARGADEIIVRRVGDGGIAWPQSVPGRTEIAVGDRIVMVLAGQEVIGFDLVTGTELWRVQPEILDATVISAIENGFVVANAGGEVEGWRLAGGGDATSKV